MAAKKSRSTFSKVARERELRERRELKREKKRGAKLAKELGLQAPEPDPPKAASRSRAESGIGGRRPMTRLRLPDKYTAELPAGDYEVLYVSPTAGVPADRHRPA